VCFFDSAIISSPVIHVSSARHGRRRFKHWRRGPTPAANSR
jgi:hypothetical protein